MGLFKVDTGKNLYSDTTAVSPRMDEVYWDRVFGKRINSIPMEEYIKTNVNLLYGKTVLDLGAGDGRNSIYLHENGFQVTAVDFSETGLKKINSLYPDIKTIKMNINNNIELSTVGIFDNIILNHFIPDTQSLERLPDLLNENGMLTIVAFDTIMKKERKNTKNLIIGKEQLDLIKRLMDVLALDQIKDELGVFNRGIFRKRQIL